ncbi:TonB-dependent receptor [Thauera linaloolentis]|uniref:Putative TonB-dependent receptor n=1 Tax=Thauera linaloolentis (strain DSM 12138 / JCM 21573 / CCUG 41526 / CIP 105981 / IAM 15112 / NBRC 102519 / 47Lol) TaxID=1123367 RepID=N6Z6W0_THAL4|nr:TonB-dependent receptor [Thauera linaloolentis]ENO87884.1 putative TonB-dependent receptor [Thauera linaloolentis 47Lol = DSM 12138]MCM8567581.1 TonB-dependent receptor [Thauera linaloolentis]
MSVPPRVPPFPLRPAALALLLTLSGAIPAAALAQSTAASSHSYDLPAAPLAATLNRISREAGLALTVDTGLVASRQAAPVRGQLSPEQALRAALQGSGLELVKIDTNTYTLRSALPELSGEDRASRNATELKSVLVTGRRTPDEIGREDVFERNVSNLYVDRDYLERFQVNAAGDVLKGLNGVYNMNTRTAGGAITPNIRGITGKGRIPVSIDGTEQTVDVWMNNYGVGDRNYIDSALFRSIAVDKGPDIAAGHKTGVGGSVVIRTIDAEDIVPEGERWGLQIKTDLSNNAAKPQHDLSKFLGWDDYRTLPGGATADGAGGGVDWMTGDRSPFSLITDEAFVPRNKDDRGKFDFGDDRSLMIAGAFRTELSDGMLAYSYRKKGNYFAGKRDAGGYLDNPVYDEDYYCGRGTDCIGSDSFIPNMAKMYKSGDEVFNSNTRTETVLAKNSWYLGDNQKISVEFMRNDILFGEINPFQTQFQLNFSELNPNLMGKVPPMQVQTINSNIRSDTYKLGYEWKSGANPLIDLKANLWRVKTTSERHQSGGMSLGVHQPDVWYDAWYWCNVRKQLPDYMDAWGSCDMVGLVYGFDENTTREEMIAGNPNDDGRYRVISGAEQRTSVTRDGFDIANLFRLNDRFRVNVRADFQREKLDEQNRIVNGQDLFNFLGTITSLANMAGPRGGRREEWGVNTSFDWQVTSKLNLQAGVRYHEFWAYDDALARERRNGNGRYGLGSGHDQYTAGIVVPYYEIMDGAMTEEYKAVMRAQAEWNAEGGIGGEAQQAVDALYLAFKEKYGVNPIFDEEIVSLGNAADGKKYKDGNFTPVDDAAYYRLVKDVIAPYRNGKLDVSAVTERIRPEMFDEQVENPQGQNGSYYKYLIGDVVSGTRALGDNPYDYNEIKQEIVGAGQAMFEGTNASEQGRVRQIPQDISEEEKWREPQKIKGRAWSPMLALTYAATDNSRIFLRYAQMTRFPSIYESTASEPVSVLSRITTPGIDLKPERSHNWEAGYAFNFAPYWRPLLLGDVRLTYYHNTIKDVIDTSSEKRIIQYDKRINKGVELLARVDTGRYFASLGGTYRLKQVTCDRSTAVSFDLYLRRAPECIDGGFGATRGYQSLQPKYSMNLDVGTRLLNDDLELGLRAVYHSEVETGQYDKLVEQGFWRMFETTGKPYHWRSSLVIDAYGRYRLARDVALHFGVTNLTDLYYLDPMSNVPTPGPGRTVSMGVQFNF